ncbi:MAG: hypothetical protein K8S24_07890 [Candidatus Aegiribacteria sp.]|nr:hypothetical protein [Candidatus Aegiribacteria sp.]
MRYVDFRDMIQSELRGTPAGLTWPQIQESLELPRKRPCSTWVRRMEEEIGLERVRGSGRAFVWKLRQHETG